MVEGDWKGALVFEESADSVKARRRANYQLIGISVFMFILFGTITIYSYNQDPEGEIDYFTLATIIVGAPILIAYLLITVRGNVSYKFYENGFEFSSSGSKLLIPYSRFDRLDPPHWFNPGFYRLMMKKNAFGLRGKIPLPTQIFISQEHIEFLNSRLANPCPTGPFVPVATEETRKRLRMLEYMLYPLAWVASVISIIGIIGFDMMPGQLIMGFYFAVMFAPALCALFIIFGAQMVISLAKTNRKFRSEKLSVAAFISVIVFSLIMSPVGYVAFEGTYPPVFNPDPGAAPSVSMLAMGNYSDTVLYPLGDVLVDGTLVLDNVTLTMADGAQIWVASQGDFHVRNSTLQSNGTFKFRSFGGLDMDNSSVANLWGKIDWPTEWGGIEVYGGNADIANCTVGPVATRAFMVANTGATIRNCTMAVSDYESIVLVNSPSTIQGNSMNGGETGILIWNSTGVEIAHNSITGNEDGIVLLHSEANIHNNSFADIPWSAMNYDLQSALVQSNNTYLNVFEQVTREDSEMPGMTFIAFFFMEAVIVLAILYRMNKKLIEWNRDPVLLAEQVKQ